MKSAFSSSLQLSINQKLIKNVQNDPLDGLYTFINPFSYARLRKGRVDIRRFDHIGFDGISMCILWNLLYGIKVERSSFDFTSFAKLFFTKINNSLQSVFVIGSKETEIKQFINLISKEFDQVLIAGFRNGYFKNIEDRKKSIEEILLLNPDFIIVGMGAVYQEQYLLDLKKAGWAGCGFTCGGFIHQTAKLGLNYYPKKIDKLNLRWLFRIFDEPKLFKRYAFQYPMSILLVILDSIKYRLKKHI